MDPYKTKYIALFLWSMYSFNVPFSPKYTILQDLETRKYLFSFLDITLTNVVLLNLAWRPALSSYQHTTHLSRSVWVCLGLFDIGHLRFENLERLTVNCRHYKHLHAVKVGISLVSISILCASYLSFLEVIFCRKFLSFQSVPQVLISHVFVSSLQFSK